MFAVVKKMDSDDSESNSNEEEYWLEDDIEFKRLCGLAVKAIIIARNLRISRSLCHTSEAVGHRFVHRILNGNARRCYEMFRLHVPVFRQLCKDLVTHYGLKVTRNMSIEESVAIFLICLAHGCTNRFMQ